MPYDLLIKNGTVVDGTGAPRFRADVGVQGGKITALGKLGGRSARTLDADGLVVSPGFFDLHTHYDCQLLWDPLATSSCWHGVTTVLIGNCGFGIAPGSPADSDYLMRMMARVEGISLDVLRHGLDWSWDTFGQYLQRIEQRGLGVNVAALVGHSALRYSVMGPASYQRVATSEEIGAMKKALQEALAAGAMGFSTSHLVSHVGGYGEPVPSRLSTAEELLDLSGVLGESGYGVIGMLPKPGASVIGPEFRDLMVSMAKAAGRPVLWNQLMHRWDMPDEWRSTMQYMDEANSQGAPIYALARCQSMDMEFNLRRTSMFDSLPTWKEVLAKPHQEKKRLLANAEVRARLRQEWKLVPERTAGRRTDLLEVQRARLPQHKALEGKRVNRLAAERGKHAVDYLLDLALAEDLDTQFVYIGSMNGDPQAVEQIIQGRYSLPGLSDAGAHLDMDCGVDFVAVLLGHWVRDGAVMTLEEAVRRLTSMSAHVLGVTDRGLLREGMTADIVLFNPASIAAASREMVQDLPGGGERIIQRAEGIQAVVVNGEVLIEQGRATGSLPGHVLRTGPSTPQAGASAKPAHRSTTAASDA